MSEIKSENYTNVPVSCTFGNVSSNDAGVTLAAGQIADEIQLMEVPAGTKISDVKMVNAALGASSTISIGWRYKSGTAGGGVDALLAATDTSSAAVTRGDQPTTAAMAEVAVITATIAGGAVTGRLDVNVLSVQAGTL